VTVVTRHWNSEDNSRNSYIAYDNRPVKKEQLNGFTVYYLPYTKKIERTIGEKWVKKISPLRKLYYFLLASSGKFNIDMDAGNSFTSFLNEHLKENTYDVLIVTTPPFNLIPVAKKFSVKFKLPYVVDFRDLWNNNEMRKGFQYRGTDRLLFLIIKKYIANWIRDARLVTVATPPMATFIRQIGYKRKIEVILNGYEENFYNRESSKKNQEKFVIGCVGTLYIEQDIKIFIDGFELFLRQKPGARIEIRFIGAGFNNEIELTLRQHLPSQHLHLTARVSKEAAEEELLNTDILYYAGWKGYEGILTSKIFDYLAAKKNILIAPGDDSSIDQLITTTRSGRIANDSQEVCGALTSWYLEWERSGSLKYDAHEEVVKNYSREKQSKLFSTLIKQLFPINEKDTHHRGSRVYRQLSD
jgi:glycosyltransferase involved in cell wall biosynthesis